MVDATGIFYMVVIGLILYVVGRQYKDYTAGILSGLFLFILGLVVWINPVIDISALNNTLLGSVLFGFGAYVWIRGSLELIKD